MKSYHVGLKRYTENLDFFCVNGHRGFLPRKKYKIPNTVNHCWKALPTLLEEQFNNYSLDSGLGQTSRTLNKSCTIDI